MLIPRVRTAQYLSESRGVPRRVLPRALGQAGSGCALCSEFSAAPVVASNARAQCRVRSARCGHYVDASNALYASVRRARIELDIWLLMSTGFWLCTGRFRAVLYDQSHPIKMEG